MLDGHTHCIKMFTPSFTVNSSGVLLLYASTADSVPDSCGMMMAVPFPVLEFNDVVRVGTSLDERPAVLLALLEGLLPPGPLADLALGPSNS